MNGKIDYKKEYRDLYQPKTMPSIIEIPEIAFLMIEGRGNPNEEGGDYKKALEALYSVTWTIKMSKMGKNKPAGYFEYVVPPLEGLWWTSYNRNETSEQDQKNNYCWVSMIRQPEFVTPQIFHQAVDEAKKKKPAIDFSNLHFDKWKEGLCIQILHKGTYDTETKSFALMEHYLKENGYTSDISYNTPLGNIKGHHEIYINDPTRNKPENLKTVLRLPVRKL